MNSAIERLKALQHRYERWQAPALFCAGFLFDIFTLGRIDSLATILQQAGYLLLCCALISHEWVREGHHPFRQAAVHFLLGSLLSSYTLFYFKSASALSSLLFVGVLSGVMVVNEFSQAKIVGRMTRTLLTALCALSYFIYLFPILLGFLGWIPFLLALAASLALAWGWVRLLSRMVPECSRLRLPLGALHGVFLLLYLLEAIPPVPLSASYIGIYHGVEKKDGEYHLSYTRPRWRFWENGDQTFLARTGDRIHCFVRIFSPTRFKDQVRIRWSKHSDRRGWESSDAIPLEIVGGRDNGYRAVTYKANYEPGEWKVSIETDDGRELGSARLTVIADAAGGERSVRTEVQ